MKLTKRRFALQPTDDPSTKADATRYHLSQSHRGRLCAGYVVFTDEFMEFAVDARSFMASEICRLRKEIRNQVQASS